MKILEILDCFAGIGGNRSLWDNVNVTAIEYDSEIADLYKKRFPKDLVQVKDVFLYLRDKNIDLNQFDLIWASPPCQTHSQMQKFNPSKIQRRPIPDMKSIYGLKIWLEQNYDNYYVIENVQPYYKTPIIPTCRIDRHIFWTNFHVVSKKFKEPIKGSGQKIGGIIRATKNNELLKEYAFSMGLEEIYDEIIKINTIKHKKETIIRNCVDPQIGKYILDQLREYMDTNRKKQASLVDFI